MPRLVDTSIRLLSQEPLAGSVPTADLLRLAEILDAAGYAALEVSGGGAFDSAVRFGLESPWERIRALKARTQTPLALALRGRFLVGSRPVGDELVGRFIASAAQSGIDVFRIQDPLNDPDNFRMAARAVEAAGRAFHAGLVYGAGGDEALVETARALAALGAARVVLADPAGLLEPHRAGQLVEMLAAGAGLPVGLYCQGAARNGLAIALEAVRAGADLVACAVYPVALATHRVSAESLAQALAGIGHGAGVDVERMWDGAELVDRHLGDVPVAPLVPRVSVRAARRKLPLGLVSVLEAQLARRSQADRLDEVLDEVQRVQAEVGMPPLVAPIGQIIGSQALVNVLGASRYATILDELRDLALGRFGQTPAPLDAALRRAVELLPAEPVEEADMETLREQARGLASSEEDLLLLALFGPEAEPLLRAIRGRAGGDQPLVALAAEVERERRIRAVVEILRESGVGEITVEEEGVRISVRGVQPESPAEPRPASVELDAAAAPAHDRGLVAVESPMVGTFYRRPRPDAPPFVEEGDPVAPGQVLCILEAMKLMNEVKAELEAIVRGIHVGDAEPVEYGQLLFELEPVDGRPIGV